MFHIFKGQLEVHGTKNFLVNELLGIDIQYNGTQKKGTWFLFPYMDDNNKTIHYFAFDTIEQKTVFEQMMKISGI